MSQSRSTAIRDALHALGVPEFLPEGYRPFGKLICGGLAFFLERLRSDRVSAILREQASLTGSPAPRLFVAILRHCPTLHKLGQVVARDRRLASSLRWQLQRLESMTATTSIGHVEELLRLEIPKADLREVRLGPQPIAEASVAVVAPFSWDRCDGSPTIRGVFKVLRPGVEEKLAEELALLPALGSFLEERSAELGLPPVNYRETLERVRELLSSEVRLEHEQCNLAEARCAFRDVPQAVIPELLPFHTPRVTAMTFIEGPIVANLAGKNDVSGKRAARAIVESLISRTMFAAESNALFHADPHAGNLLFTPDGRLGVIDWSLAGHLRKEARENIVQIVLGGATFGRGRIGRAIDDLAKTPTDATALRSVIDASLRSLRDHGLPGLGWLTGLLDQAVLRANVRLEGDLLLFRKVLLTLEGVIGDLDDHCPVDAMLLAEASRRLILEWPARLVQSPGSRRLSTHLSNLDLANLMWIGPSACFRFMAGNS